MRYQEDIKLNECAVCKEKKLISKILKVCKDCIIERFDQSLEFIKKAHNFVKEKYSFCTQPLKEGKLSCNMCINNCKFEEGTKSICGLREFKNNKLDGPDSKNAKLFYYYDLLPTNCVASFICGENKYTGYKNLAVFFYGCSFNCLFCQNSDWRNIPHHYVSLEELEKAIDETTKCICFFGGDPSCQIEFQIEFSKRILRSKKVRICWETNGSFNPKYLDQIMEIALKSKGCVKFDLKAFNKNLHFALCGVSNEFTLENFKRASFWTKKYSAFPLLVASTLLVPGYIDESEIESIAKFIASLNKEIPYSLLGFSPNFFMKDIGFTSKNFALKSYRIAKAVGLKYVNIGNTFILK